MNYKFIQPVSMRVTKEQYERDLREPLLAMGYKEVVIEKWEELPILVTNLGSAPHHLSKTRESLKTEYNRYFIDHYNPKLFLAIAAMSNIKYGIYGEWWYCTENVKMLSDGRIEYDKGKLYMGMDNERIINNSRDNDHYWRDDNRFEHFRKATLQELIEKFTNQKQDVMKEITNEQFNELKNLIAPENVEKFNKLFKVNKNAIKEDLDLYTDFGTGDISIAAGVFGCDGNFLPFRENYHLRSLWVNNNIDIHIVEGSYGDKLIMFNEKD